MNIKAGFLFFSLVCGLLLAGCGQKGDLYLPEGKKAEKEIVKVEANKAADTKEKAKTPK